MTTPLYKHDCEQCKFLGINKEKTVDLYFCERDCLPVVRRSSDGSDYSSGFGVPSSEIKEAIEKAIKLKLIRRDRDN